MADTVPRRVDAGDVLAALGAALVLVALFADWFGEANGWEAFESLDLLLAASALAALAAAAAGAGLLAAPSPRVLAPLGAALVAVVLVQIVQPPPVVEAGDTGTGAWLALAGAALVLVGGLLRVARVSVSVAVSTRDVRRRVPAVDRRPAADAPAAPSRDEAVRLTASPHHEQQPTRPFGAVEGP